MYVCVCEQNLLIGEAAGFKIAMGAFDQTRPPVSTLCFIGLASIAV